MTVILRPESRAITPMTAKPPRGRRRSKDRNVVARLAARRWSLLGVAVLVAAAMLMPLYLLIVNAFKTGIDYSRRGPLALPEAWTLDAFRRFLGSVDYARLLTNSAVIAGTVAVFAVVLSMLAAYAIGIGRVRGRTWIIFVLLMATILPQEALIYPLFAGAQALGLQNSIWSVTIIFTVLQSAFGTYILSSVLSTFPRELIEAARVDGANRWTILTRVVVPVMRPTMSVLLVFFFVWTWNEFFIPMVMLISPRAQTLPIALAALQGQHTLDVTQLAAASLLSLLPTLVFFLIFQRTLTRGVTAGAVK